MEVIQDKLPELPVSDCLSDDTDNGFPDQQIPPRVGDEYQADIPLLVAECERLQIILFPTESEAIDNIRCLYPLVLPIPIMWVNPRADRSNGTVGSENSVYSQVTCNDGCSKPKVDAADLLSSNEKDAELHVNLQHLLGDDKMEYEALPPESETKKNLLESSLYPFPGSLGSLWTEFEYDSFLLGLYIFGKNLVLVKKFVESKGIGDVLCFYYGKFFRSAAFLRWAECRKQKSKRGIFGQKIFTGWRQQELLSRLSSHVSQECQFKLLELSRTYGDGKLSYENYVFALRKSVGVKLLIEAVSIGKGKQDLTSVAIEPAKSNHVSSARPEIPSGKACSSLTSLEIVQFLTGDYRLSKARSNDLFWEAVWPRLLARGWHSEQPRDGISGSKHTLVFLTPGIKKFSRKLVKGNHYFDSVADVLNKVASEPKLLELEIDSVKDDHNKENELDIQSKEKRGSLPKSMPKKRPHCYLQPQDSVRNHKQKFTIIDTSLACGAEPRSIIELRSLPTETASESTSSSLSSESDEDFSDNDSSNNEAVETAAPTPVDDTIDRACALPSNCLDNRPSDTESCAMEATVASEENHKDQSSDLVNKPATVASDENHKDQSSDLVNKPVQDKDTENQFSEKIKSGDARYMVSCTQKQVYSPCKTTTCPLDPPANPSRLTSLVKGAKDCETNGIAGEICQNRESSPVKPPSPKSIDLNTPQGSSSGASESIAAKENLNIENARANKPPSPSEPSPKTKHSKSVDLVAPLEQEPIQNGRRQSTRNRPMTTKALEALELGLFSTNKKRRSDELAGSSSRSSRRVHKKAVEATPSDAPANAQPEPQELIDGPVSSNDMVS